MTHHTAEEVAQNYTEVMGPQLGKVFYRLYNECSWLHIEWKEFVALFGKSERVDLLNATAPGFARVVQDALWNEVLLHISRLTDQERVGGGDGGTETLTLRMLPNLVKSEIKQKVKELLKDVETTANFARDWRNRHIGHRELRLALEESTKPLTPATKQKVDEAIAAIAALLNAVDTHYRKSAVAYDVVDVPGSSVELLYLLRDGLDARAERQERLIAGDFGPNDLKPKPPI